MGIRGRCLVSKWLDFVVVFGILGVPVQVLGAGPEITGGVFPEYHPAHTVIKCPYLPPDLVEIPTCGDKEATCLGTDGHDLILGSDKNDVIVAGAGNDVVHADAMHDVVCGGSGDDSLFGARGSDELYGGPGDDWLFGAADSNTLFGEEGDFDVLWGGPSWDLLDGGSGSRDVCMLQDEQGGDYDEHGCNTAFRAKDVCTPAWVEADSVVNPEQHEDD